MIDSITSPTNINQKDTNAKPVDSNQQQQTRTVGAMEEDTRVVKDMGMLCEDDVRTIDLRTNW